MTSKRTPGPHLTGCPPLTDCTIFRAVNRTAISVQQIRRPRHPTPRLPNDASFFIRSTNLLPSPLLATAISTTWMDIRIGLYNSIITRLKQVLIWERRSHLWGSRTELELAAVSSIPRQHRRSA